MTLKNAGHNAQSKVDTTVDHSISTPFEKNAFYLPMIPLVFHLDCNRIEISLSVNAAGAILVLSIMME